MEKPSRPRPLEWFHGIPARSSLIGKVLNHYEILSSLGKGGMGEVYRARDTRLGREVALKILPKEITDDRELLDRFEREARTVAALNHPHIVHLYSVEETEECRFLSMELVEGQTLEAHVTEGGLPLPRILHIAVAIADALDTAHRQGIVHRDLKPANIMITPDGRVKVLDFGLAKLAKEVEALDGRTMVMSDSSPLTTRGAMLGTVPYMSPEQLRAEDVDARTDIFSLGILLYELAVGERPFVGKSASDVISATLRDDPPSLVERRPDLAGEFAHVVKLCLAKEVEARTTTAKNVHDKLLGLQRALESGAFTPVSGIQPSLVANGEIASSRRPWMIAGVALGALAIAGAVWLGRNSSDTVARDAADKMAASSQPDTNDPRPLPWQHAADLASVAVLPLINMSPDEENGYFSDGLTEELLNVLAGNPRLRVAGRTSSFSFRERGDDLRSIGHKLNVAHLLEGSVRKSGDQVRITVQLVNTDSGFQLWSETYDRTLEDIFAVQDDIAASVAEALEATLLGTEHAIQVRPENVEAYNQLLQARYLLGLRTNEDAARAQGLLEQAIELEPDYAMAWAELALAYRRQGMLETSPAAMEQANVKSRQALQRALAINPQLAEALARLAGMQAYNDWNWSAAEKSAQEALKLAPNNPIVLGNAALVWSALGRKQEALGLLEKAVAVDPLNQVGYYNLARLYLVNGQLTNAEATYEKLLELNPQGSWASYGLGQVYLHQGRWDEALEQFKSEPDEVSRLEGLAMTYHSLHDLEQSDALLAQFVDKYGANFPVEIAGIYAYRGDADAAFEWLTKAHAAGHPSLAEVWTTPNLRPLERDPRWGVLLDKMGLQTTGSS